MLILSLTLSAVFLIFVNFGARSFARPVAAVLGCGAVLAILPALLGLFFSPPLAVQVLLVCIAVMFCPLVLNRPWGFLAVSLSATAIAYGVAVFLALQDQREFAHLRERFPYESMEERLPTPPPRTPVNPLSGEAEQRLTVLEDYMRDGETHRTIELERLHEDKVRLFTNSPGFGVGRMLFRPSESGLTSGLRPDDPIPQPALIPYPTERVNPSLPEPSVVDRQLLHGLHQDSIVDFAYPRGFGHFKDRRHVAGFQSHRFSEMPGPAERWKIRRLDLVGLLLHDEPVVYMTENLPHMDEVRDAPTRPLDGFETAALERVRHGEDLITGGTPGGMRVLGAIRSVKQCVRCHGGERGDLLGAFSYTLRRSK